MLTFTPKPTPELPHYTSLYRNQFIPGKINLPLYEAESQSSYWHTCWEYEAVCRKESRTEKYSGMLILTIYPGHKKFGRGKEGICPVIISNGLLLWCDTSAVVVFTVCSVNCICTALMNYKVYFQDLSCGCANTQTLAWCSASLQLSRY